MSNKTTLKNWELEKKIEKRSLTEENYENSNEVDKKCEIDFEKTKCTGNQSKIKKIYYFIKILLILTLVDYGFYKKSRQLWRKRKQTLRNFFINIK